MIASLTSCRLIAPAAARATSDAQQHSGHNGTGEHQCHIAGAVVRCGGGAGGGTITRVWAPGASASPGGTLKVSAATGSTTP